MRWILSPGNPDAPLVAAGLVHNPNHGPGSSVIYFFQGKGVVFGRLHHGQRDGVPHLQIQLFGNVLGYGAYAALPRFGILPIGEIQGPLLEGLQSGDVIAGFHLHVVVAQLIFLGVLCKDAVVEYWIIITVKGHPGRLVTALVELRHPNGTAGTAAVIQFSVEEVTLSRLR